MSTSRRSINLRTRSKNPAFTLVEMLVVLGIIGILIALLLPALMRMVTNARNFRISMEIKNLHTALDTYKQQRGEYPPCFGDYDSMGNLVYSNAMTRNTSVVERHLQRCYPKFTNAMAKNQFYGVAAEVDQAEALVLWLSLTSTNPANPFEMTATRHGYYDFKPTQLIANGDSDGIGIYVSPYTREQPYIYVENRNYLQHVQQNCAPKALTPDGTTQRALPYGASATTPMNPTTFQILSAGQDGDWGNLTTVSSGRYVAKEFPAGTNYFPGDRDNLTNFSEGRTLGDSRPQ